MQPCGIRTTTAEMWMGTGGGALCVLIGIRRIPIQTKPLKERGKPYRRRPQHLGNRYLIPICLVKIAALASVSGAVMGNRRE